jgi:penicillin-binding protein-related factor A (putative recombinase)
MTRRLPIEQAGLPGVPAAAPRAPTVAQAGGKKAKEAGKAAEAHVAKLNEVCEAHGVAKLWRVPNPFEPVEHLGGWFFKCVAVKGGLVDFFGILRGGRVVAVEVKHVQEDPTTKLGLAALRFPFALLAEHQVAQLEIVHRWGGLAVVVVCSGGAAYALPWGVLQAAMGAGRKSLTGPELAPYKVCLNPTVAYLEELARRPP